MIFYNQNRRLLSRQVGYSGEILDIEIPSGIPGIVPEKCHAVLYDVQRRPLAVSADPFDGEWKTKIDTATERMSNEFSGILANTARVLGFAVVTNGAIVVMGGAATIVSAPFPDELSPLPEGVTDPLVRVSDLVDLIKPGTNVEIEQNADGSITIKAAGGGTGTGISQEVAEELKTNATKPRTIAALAAAIVTFAEHYIPKA